MKPDSLAYLWKSLRSREVRRALFFTYRFNFRWFHDQVLSNLRHGPWRNAQITVIASRFGDETASASGDLYSLGEWASMPQLKIRYLPAQPVYHAKFILAELVNGSLVFGGGSANLTGAGWTGQAELWSWGCRAAVSSCHAFLTDLASRIGPGLLEPWIAQTRASTSRAGMRWLTGDKASARKRAFARLWDGNHIGTPKRVVVASPYFDAHSQAVMDELLAMAPRGVRRDIAIEIWTDASASVARGSDYEQLAKLAVRYKALVRAPFDKGFALPLHLKAIEATGTKGRRTLFGSANFTGAAWMGGNREALFMEDNGHTLELLFKEYELRQQSIARLRALAARTASSDAFRDPNVVYWAVYDERQRRLIISFRSIHKVVRLRVEASVDKRRFGDERARLEKVARIFSSPGSWYPPRFKDGVATMDQRIALQIPERLSVVLQLSNGRELRAGVDPNAPDFGENGTRDPQTGMPWDLSSAVTGIVGIPQLIARPLPKVTTREASGETEDNDEEELQPETAPTLTTDADYHLEPEGVRVARRIRRASRGERTLLKELINRRLQFVEDPRERLLIQASLKALET
jgi:hypothetical protein